MAIIIRKKRIKESTEIGDLMGAMLGLLMIYTGTIIGSAFLLTKPPAVSELGDSELATVGLGSCFIITCQVQRPT